MLHELKIYPMHFNDILKNNKNFEVRKDDRLYEVGDYLYLREYLPADEYTGKEILAKVLVFPAGAGVIPARLIIPKKGLCFPRRCGGD